MSVNKNPAAIEAAIGTGQVPTRTTGLRNSSGGTSIWFLTGQVVKQEPVRHIPIHTTPFRIGRRSDMALSIPCATVSGKHAEIVDHGDRVVLRDLKSTNGTYVNGERLVGECTLNPEDLVQFADIPFRVRRHSTQLDRQTVHEDLCDQALALVQFDKLMTNNSVIPVYQPIIDLADNSLIGYEVLARSEVFGLETPTAMFRAAAQLDLELELSRMSRWEGIRATSSFESPPHLFVNTHPNEVSDCGLIESMRAVRVISPKQQITLEIHEAAVTNVPAMRDLKKQLKDLDIGLAYDDFGAGQNRLLELLEVQPDYLKFDMAMIRNVHLATRQHHSLLQSLIRNAEDLGIISLAEGIETAEEDVACKELGFRLAQGFFYGKPAPASIFVSSPR